LLGHEPPARDLRPARRSGLGEAHEPLPEYGEGAQQRMLEDLRRRFTRACATPVGPRRAALLVALRYRLSVERASLSSPESQAALAALEAEIDRQR
jgi:hypothetical protein